MFRIIPTLVWLFIIYFGITPMLNLELSGEAAAKVVHRQIQQEKKQHQKAQSMLLKSVGL